MQGRIAALLACAAALAAPRAVRADECVVNGTPVAPATLAAALEAGLGVSLPGQLAGVPFSVVHAETTQIHWLGCADDCLSSTPAGEARCGNLVEDPIDFARSLEVAGLGQPNAFVDIAASQSATGKWEVGAAAFVHPEWNEESGSAAFGLEVGTREVIDVSSASAAEELPLEIQLQAVGQTGLLGCTGDVFRWNPNRTLQFRVTEESNLPPFTRPLVPTQYFGGFLVERETFALAVRPNATLVIEVWLRASANATGASDIHGNQCRGGYALFYFQEPPEPSGIQIRLSGHPALTLTPRSGIAYLPVPEPPGGGSAAALTLLGVAAHARRVSSGGRRSRRPRRAGARARPRAAHPPAASGSA
ncbi:MAG TPA: hypothetical protein VIN04_01620 [Myxococcota bacterium]